MTSPQKIRANRANARASAGPRTARGRAHASRNARRHGLSLSIFADPALSEQVEAFAREIAGDTTDDDIYQLARRVAEAQIDLQRVRLARHQLLCDQLVDEPRADARAKLKVIKRLLTPTLAHNPLAAAIENLITTPKGPAKLAAILSEEAKHLVAMDRYERRALSQRKFTIRAFDQARRAVALADNST